MQLSAQPSSQSESIWVPSALQGQGSLASRSIHQATSSCRMSAHQARGRSSSEGEQDTVLRKSRINATASLSGSSSRRGTSQQKLSGSDLTQHCAMTIHRERDKRTNVGEGVESAILVRLENGGHGTPLRAHLCQEIGCHRLAINNQVGQLQSFGGLVVAGEYLRNPVRQMQITALRARTHWMPLVVMQQ